MCRDAYGAPVGLVDDRVVSLAAGVVLDIGPDEAVSVASTAGFDAVGVWFDPRSWTPSTTQRVRQRLDDTGMVALDIEPVIVGRGDADAGERLIDAGIEVGAHHALVATGAADRAEALDVLGALAERASGSDLTLVLEYVSIFSVSTLAEAVSIVDELAAPNVGVLVDNLHHARAGGTVDEVARVVERGDGLLPYLQLADAPSAAPGDLDGLRTEAVDGRLLPGDGELPLRQMLDAVPGVPVSLELRSSALMSRYPDPVERARAVAASVRSGA